MLELTKFTIACDSSVSVLRSVGLEQGSGVRIEIDSRVEVTAKDRGGNHRVDLALQAGFHCRRFALVGNGYD